MFYGTLGIFVKHKTMVFSSLKMLLKSTRFFQFVKNYDRLWISLAFKNRNILQSL